MKRLLVATIFFSALAWSTAAAAFQPLYSCGGGTYAAWPPNEVPVEYWITSSGSATVPFSTVQNVFASSFSEWGGPCCSGFGGSYQGTTSSQPWQASGSQPIILGFTQSQWSQEWGSTNSTIGVTLVRPGFGCSLDQAPIVFNEIGFTFTTNGNTGNFISDLESIATHEIGHLLGLDHSQFTDATMFAAYQGGTGARSLHQDDREGACELYFAAQCSCTSTAQCGPDEVCMNNVCRLPPCSTNADCDNGLSCLPNGDCGIPPCNSDADCVDGYQCQQNRCVSACPVCRTCETDDDCPSQNSQCFDLGEGLRCTVFCNLNATVQDLVCPGDSVCVNWDLDGPGGNDPYPLCSAPDFQQTNKVCSDGYVCVDDGTFNECGSAADCPDGASCINTPDGSRCDIPDLCADVVCGEGLICEPSRGFCIRDENAGNNTPGNNTTGNNTAGNNTPGNNTPGNNGGGNNANNGGGPNVNNDGGNDDDPLIIVRANDPVDEDAGCCAVTSPQDVPGTLLLAIGFLGFMRRRR